MTTHDTEIVQALRYAVAGKVGPARFDYWFGAGEWLGYRNGAVVVGAPNQFHQDWLRSNFRDQIEAGCLEALGRSLPLEFHIDAALDHAGHASQAVATGVPGLASVPAVSESAQADIVGAGQGDDAADEAPEPANGSAADAGHAPAAGAVPSGGAGQGGRTWARRRFARLQSFVVGESNRMAFTAAQIASTRLGEMSPMYFHGPAGVGKTHLLEGIWSAVRRAMPDAVVVYLSAEQFTTIFQDALHRTGLPNFRRKYRGVDLLLIDDVQFFRGKPRTVSELLHTLDTLGRAGRQVVLSGDSPPTDLADISPELSARLQGGMVARLDLPDYPTRLGIVSGLTGGGAVVPEDVREFVARRIAATARDLAGAVNRLLAASQALSQPITLPLAHEALRDLIQQASPMVGLAEIGRAVCRAFNVAPETLKSGRKARSASHPRMLAMWLARKYTRVALGEIGEFFGCRSHSTVVSAWNKVNAWRTEQASLQLAGRQWGIDEAIRRAEDQLRTG